MTSETINPRFAAVKPSRVRMHSRVFYIGGQTFSGTDWGHTHKEAIESYATRSPIKANRPAPPGRPAALTARSNEREKNQRKKGSIHCRERFIELSLLNGSGALLFIPYQLEIEPSPPCPLLPMLTGDAKLRGDSNASQRRWLKKMISFKSLCMLETNNC